MVFVKFLHKFFTEPSIVRSRSFQCYKSQTMGETDFGWDDEVEDDLVDNMVRLTYI